MLFRLKRLLKGSYGLRFVVWLFVHNLIDLAAILFSSRPAPTGRRTVLFVKLDGIGDYVIWRTTFDRLRRLYPTSTYRRVLIGNEKWKELAGQDDIFDQCWFIDHDRFVIDPFYRFSVMRAVRRLAPQIVVQPRFTRSFFWEDSIVRISDADEKIGSSGLNNLMTSLQEKLSGRWYTKLVDAPSAGEHELESHAKFLTALGGDGVAERSIDLPFRRERRARAYAVLLVGTSDPGKQWPVDRFVRTADYLRREHGLDLVLCGGPGDRAAADEFLSTASGEVRDLVGKQDLTQLTDTIVNAGIVVTNDTGGGHIAALHQVPTVVLTPGNHIGRYFPYPRTAGASQISVMRDLPCFGCGWECVYKDLDPASPKPCIEKIATDDAIDAIETLLGNPKR